jgi:hypothetical protein
VASIKNYWKAHHRSVDCWTICSWTQISVRKKGTGTVRTGVYLGYVKAGIPLVLSVLLLLQRFDRRNSPNTFDGLNGVKRSPRPSIRCLFQSHVSENHDRQFHLSEQWTNSAQEGSRIETHLTLKDFMPFRMF